jgi:hypothetical protein
MAILVYKYGTHSGTTLPDEAIDQLRLACQMRNDLVADALDEEEAVKALWSTDPAVAAIEEDLTVVEDNLENLVKQAKAEHDIDRTIATRPTTSAAIKAARATVRDLREGRRQAIGVIRLRLKPDLEQIRAAHRDARKLIRQTYADKGLYWGTYNAILDDHAVSRKLVAAARKDGRRAQLRFHRFDGTGTLTIQLQRQAGDPPRSPATIAAGNGKWRNVFGLTKIDGSPEAVAAMTDAERKRTLTDRGILTWTLGQGASFQIPVTVHRPISPDADITGAQLTVRRIGAHHQITVAVTARVPDPAPAEGRPPVALHCGWRTRPDGSVRVATWAAATPVEVPPALADVVVSHGGQWGEIVLPAAWIEYATRPSALRGQRDLNLAPVQAKLADWLDQHPQPGDDDRPELTGAVVRQWHSPGRFASLAIRWRDEPPPYGRDIAALLEAWRKQDKHLWEWEAHQRVRGIGRRDDAWRRVGAWLAGLAGVLITEETDLLAVMRQQLDPADDDPVLHGAGQRAARRNAVLAAPGALRQYARVAAARRGVTVRQADQAYLSRTCPHCHAVGAADPRYAASSVVTCPSCDRSYDQDHAAVTAMLARELAGVDQPGEPAKRRP